MTGMVEYLMLYHSVILFRRRVPRILLNRIRPGLYAIHLAREMVRNGEVECGWMERDAPPTKLRPAVPCRIDPPN